MSADVVAVLVVAAEGDPGGLRAVHPEFGSSPPLVVLLGGGWVGHYAALRQQAADAWDGEAWELVNNELAVPLWWDGALCPEGWDRARRVLWYGTPDRADRWDLWQQFEVDVAHLVQFGEMLVQRGLASRVVRLVRVDGRLVELEPVGVGP